MYYRAVSNTDEIVFVEAENIKEAGCLACLLIESWGDMSDYLYSLSEVRDDFEALEDESGELVTYEDGVEYLIYDRSMV